jgi:subtilisin family serine protease
MQRALASTVCLALLGVAGAARAQVDLGALVRGGARVLPRAMGTQVSTIVEVPSGADAPPGFVRVSTLASGAALGVLDLGAQSLLALAEQRPDLGVSWSPPLHLLLDRADALSHASSFRNTTGLTGRGVVLGIVDTGVDATHPDLRDANGKSRILWWLDFARERENRHPELEDALGCRTDATDNDLTACAVLSGADVEELISNESELDDPHDYGGHGTHVASLAGSSGAAIGPTHYVGVAPEASYIVARVARKSGGIFDADVLRAVGFVFERAEEAGMPAVVNLSLGTDFGGHDGLTPVERGLESMVGPEHPGRAIVVAAGNSGGLYTGVVVGAPEPLGVHTEVHVGAGASTLVPIITPATAQGLTQGTVYVWLTQRPGDELKLGLENRAGTVLAPVPRGSQAIKGNAALETTIINDVVGGGSPIPEGSPGAVVIIEGEWSSSDLFGLRLEGPATARIWVEGEGKLSPERSAGPLLPRAQKPGTVNVPASAPGLIAVGATLNRNDWVDYAGETVTFDSVGDAPPDTAAYFSSAGPNALGSLKPDLVAPGANVIGAMARGADPRTPTSGGIFDDGGICANLGYVPQCFVVDDWHVLTGGTSMSSPLVAGAIALLLQRDPTLEENEVRALLQAGARRLAPRPYDDGQLGAGALDLERTLQALDEGVTEREPGHGTELVLSESFAHPDPTWPLEGLLELRDDADDIVDGFDARRLTLTAAGATITSPLARLAPGLWRFAVAAAEGTGGRTLSLAVHFDGRSLAKKTLPIAVDRTQSTSLASAHGGCALSPSGDPTRGAPAFWLGVLLAWSVLRSRRALGAPPLH